MRFQRYGPGKYEVFIRQDLYIGDVIKVQPPGRKPWWRAVTPRGTNIAGFLKQRSDAADALKRYQEARSTGVCDG